MEHKSEGDWVQNHSILEVMGIKSRGIGRKTWGECVK